MYLYFCELVSRKHEVLSLYNLSIPVPGQVAELWVCSKHVQRKKSDLSDIDIVMSSLRDIGEEML